ncbi:MAG TPA: TRAM domain-containing protein [Kiritimatiellia bacterium]|nr:TRAM domain-containing protein [Kiritimatiellia bacterium]
MAADAAPQSPAPFLTLPKLLALLALTVAATGAVVYFAVRGGDSANEQVVTVLDARAAAVVPVNTGEVQDATAPNQFVPELGRRYRVRIDGESRDGASMIARIGRTVTFVKDVKPGDIVEVEVTRLHRTTAEAVVLSRISSGPPPVEQRAAPRSVQSVAAPSGLIYTGTVASVGKLGDGLIKRGSQQIYVPGVEKGDRVVYEVTEQGERFWTGRLIQKLDATAAEPAAKSAPDSLRAPQVQVGGEYEVVVKEKERSKPDTDGVARIDGLAVLIPGCQPGDRVKIRITERLPTLAKAEIIERLPAATP